MNFYELSQQDFQFIEEKITENPEIITQKDPVSNSVDVFILIE